MWGQVIYELIREADCVEVSLEEIRQHLKHGFPWHSPEQAHSEFFKGVSWWEHMTLHFSKIIRATGVEAEVSDRLSSQIKQKYLDITQWHVYDDTVPCLEIAQSRGYSNVIVSNHVPELAQLVNALGMGRYFTRVFSSAALGFEKPNKQLYRKVLSMFSDISEVTMIGDSYQADILGAKNAGINAVLVRAENTNNYQYYCKDLKGVFNVIEAVAQPWTVY